MGLRISFELSDSDLRFFRSALKRSRDVVRSADESEITDAIRGVIDDIRKREPLPDFVALRLPELESMLQMLADDEWRLPVVVRERILSAFVYFGDPEDILPDDIPVIGYLDDVIILELDPETAYHHSILESEAKRGLKLGGQDFELISAGETKLRLNRIKR